MAVKAFTYQYLAYTYPPTPGSGQNITVKFCGVQLTCSSLAPIALYLRDLVILSLGQRWSLFVSFIFFVEARQKLVLLGIYFSGSVIFFLLTILQCLYSPILVRFLTGTVACRASHFIELPRQTPFCLFFTFFLLVCFQWLGTLLPLMCVILVVYCKSCVC